MSEGSVPSQRRGPAPSQGAPRFHCPCTFLPPRSGQRDASNINQTHQLLLKLRPPFSLGRHPGAPPRPTPTSQPTSPAFAGSLLQAPRPCAQCPGSRQPARQPRGRHLPLLFPAQHAFPSLPAGLGPQHPGPSSPPDPKAGLVVTVWLHRGKGSFAEAGLV